jgi:hypothetical protein
MNRRHYNPTYCSVLELDDRDYQRMSIPNQPEITPSKKTPGMAKLERKDVNSECKSPTIGGYNVLAPLQHKVLHRFMSPTTGITKG